MKRESDQELLKGTPWEGNPYITVRHGVIHDTRYDRKVITPDELALMQWETDGGR